MAIARMAKFMIVSHRSQVSGLLEALQSEGICHILNADDAAITKDFPELSGAAWRPKDIELMLGRLERAVAFLKGYTTPPKGLSAALAPRAVVDEQAYEDVVSSREILRIVEQCERLDTSIEQTKSEIDGLHTTIDALGPWQALDAAVEEIGRLTRATAWTGLIPAVHLEQAREQMAELGAVIHEVGAAGAKHACLIVSLNETAEDVQKALRSAEFETVSFEGMTGTVAELVREHTERLRRAQEELHQHTAEAAQLSQHLLKLQILCDHYRNLQSREHTRSGAPTTELTVLLEGWVKRRHYSRLQAVVRGFDASSLHEIEPAEDEELPVEIENTDVIRPFESITRLYGMPVPTNLDPTVFLAPFFAVFFGLCLTDAGYGIVMVALLWLLLKKTQGDKKFMWMLLICSISTIVAGVLTGGWFGDAVQVFLPGGFGKIRESVMLFDPMSQPMVFFKLSLGLGYIQIMFGLCVALAHSLRRKDIVGAVCDKATWLLMLNSLILFGLAKGGILPEALSSLFGIMALVPAITIVLFSVREGGWGGRIGMGVFNLFCTVFYLGDVLSYVRIMALGMVSAGFGMAVNISVQLLADVPYVGWLLGALVFVAGHLLNIALSTLGSFVHSMRLQFVEFFPKFFEGGGKQFVPLSKQYKHIYVDKVKV